MAVLQLGRLQRDEQRVAVSLDLGALVGVVSVLNGQLMQTEDLLDLLQYRVVRLMQSEPHEGAGLLDGFADVDNGYVADPVAISIDHAVHEGCHRLGPLVNSCADRPPLQLAHEDPTPSVRCRTVQPLSGRVFPKVMRKGGARHPLLSRFKLLGDFAHRPRACRRLWS
jgi:hypothetical protein